MQSDTFRLGFAGAIAAAASLAVTELVASLFVGVRSPLLSVGDIVIDFSPDWLEQWAIATFGTNDKAVLIGSMIGVIVLLGAVAGATSRRTLLPAFGLFAGSASLGAWGVLRDPLQEAGPALLAVVAGALVGLGILGIVRSPVVAETPDRRRFLSLAAGATAFAVVVGYAGRARTNRMVAAVDRADLTLPSPVDPAGPVASELGVDGVSSLITPNDSFYRIDTALSVPAVPLDEWQLKVKGMVDRPFELSFEELLQLPMVERHVTISCVSNDVGGRLVGTATWLGVPLERLLDKAGVQEGATQLVGRSLDGWTAGFPTEVAFDGRDALVAVGMNGEPLPMEHGFPARLIVPGLYGYVSATKWLEEIELTTWEGFDAYWVPRGWSKEGPMKISSRIDTPRPTGVTKPGLVAIGGVAWAPNRGISRVEVRVDEGEWQEATLSDSFSDDSWRQWTLGTELAAGRHSMEVRAYDNDGAQQPEGPKDPRPDGAEGWHRVLVTVA
ncbi:MAG: molybdopterin-dependent oxidoreductase [Acidimicrobiia bacterium]|nr:molybdopterin-dependent oxidoreductase [Acidimicrobiia bacterium]